MAERCAKCFYFGSEGCTNPKLNYEPDDRTWNFKHEIIRCRAFTEEE